MENAYGIGVKNRYELFYDEDVDPLEILKQQEEEKEKRKTDKAQCKDKTKCIKAGKPFTSAGLPKKARESPPVNNSKPIETPDILSKPRTRPFSDRTSRTSVNSEENKEIEDRKNFRNREDQFNSDSRDREGEFRRGRGGFRGRGRGATRGRGGFVNFEGRSRREFDRHSGSDKTGVRHTDKRDGAGSNNWGDIKGDLNRRKEPETNWMEDDFETSADKPNESSNWGETTQENDIPVIGQEEELGEKSGDDAIADNTESKENEPVVGEPSEESVKEMTLDEWKREQEAKRAVPKYNLRKPGEGEDGNQWKKLYVLKKKTKEDDDDEEEEEEEDVDDDEFARRGRHRQLVDIQINFNDSRRGRGRGRGGRGGTGPRGGGTSSSSSISSGSVGNREVPREERNTREIAGGTSMNTRPMGRGTARLNKAGQQSAPRVDDWNDFPSLVTA